MPKLTLEAARDLQSSFQGRITSFHEAHSEVHGKPPVLIPESIEDVGRALRLAQAANRRVFVRSGRSVSIGDVKKPVAASRAAVARESQAPVAIVSMEAFRDVDVSDRRVTVGVAATTGDLARRLTGKHLFLPLDDNRTQSVASAVLSMRASPFLRSGTGSGPLRNAVVEAECVPTTGAGAGRARTLRGKALQDVLSGERPAVLTRLVLDADPSKTNESGRWTRAWTAVYERKTFAALCDALFGGGAPNVPERVDLSVRVTSAAYAMKLVLIRTTGRSDATAAEAMVQAAVQKARLTLLESSQVTGTGSSVAAWVALGPSEASSGEIVARFGSNVAPRPLARFRSAFFNAVDFTIGVNPRNGRERAPRVRAWAELQIVPGNDVIARAEIYGAEADAGVAKEARDRMAEAIPADEASPRARVARRSLLRRAPSRAILRDVTVLPDLTPTPGFDVSSNRAGADTIPGFKGDLLDESDGLSYREAIQQYAVSSYSKNVVRARMTPRFVAVPEDATDVTLAVTFAANHGLKVVTRSGGHQYCGLSSGGNHTLLLDMRLFNHVAFSGVSPTTRAPTWVTVGPGVPLRCVSKSLRDKRVVIPHGECPLVNLGGHVQTGGIGHQLRSLGATVDWVRSFKMVTRSPQPGAEVYVEREFTRPNSAGGSGAPTDDDVFRAVLGGSPSSWGVLTEITFDLLSDRAYPASAGYSYVYPYVFGATKDGLGVAMEQFRQWADRQSRGELPLGVDFFLTFVSGDFPRPPVMLVEVMCRDKAGLPEIEAVVDAVDAAVPGWVRLAAHAAAPVKGAAHLSVIADDSVRKIDVTGLPRSGREFDLPYKKSLQITKTPFSTDFRDRFVKLVDAAHESSGLKVVFQGVIGGGEFSAGGDKKTTHMQRRDALVQLVFDIFYEEGSERSAEHFQQSMKGLLGEFSGGLDARMFWGSFEDKGTNGTQLDMSLKATQDLYYDSFAEYARLQQIKDYTDPKDLFHTSFTVQSAQVAAARNLRRRAV